MNDLKGKITIVTGVGRRQGIGFAICQEIAKKGGNIFFTYWLPYDRMINPETSEENAAQFAKEFEHFGVKAQGLELDLSDPESPGVLFNKIKEMGVPDYLINNACYDESIPFIGITSENIDKHYFVNVRAVTLLCKEFISQSDLEDGKKIINMTSGQSLGNMGSDKISYTITKASIEMLTKQLSADFLKSGITIYALDPGPTDTGWMSEKMKEDIIQNSKRKKVNLPEDTAQLVCSILTNETKYKSGEVIHAER